MNVKNINIIRDKKESRIIEAFAGSESHVGAYYFIKYTSEEGWTCSCPLGIEMKLCCHVRAVTKYVNFGSED